jgi:hypothetical protein
MPSKQQQIEILFHMLKKKKQHIPKGNSWKWGRKLYGQVRKLSPIYSLNLFLEFATGRDMK